ncbi:MAG: 2-phospho-L-lactate/phosphoenolpyruvate guanylyltransferase [Actinomycetota bacterium]|nr:2-phospho-L-lactate/phosphoenolpyruvate guanylyltransferase [Actinomycetota bacterium]
MPRPMNDRWCLVVPVKRLADAKTRLLGDARGHRRDLALAFALDTVSVALACPSVEAVVVVTDEADAARLLGAAGAVVVADEPGAGLNPALVHGAAAASRAHPGCGVGALSGDLPALRVDALAWALARAPADRACFVPDADGAGTTALLARRPGDFVPAYGVGSAAAHLASGAVALTDTELESLRQDVDTAADLERALSMGVGPHTAEVARRFTTAGCR